MLPLDSAQPNPRMVQQQRMERVTCNLCGSEAHHEVRRKWNYSIVQCQRCGLAFVNPRQFETETEAYFRGPYLSTIEQDGELNAGIKYLYDQALLHISNRIPIGTLLDVGCAMGHFIRFARERGWKVEGVECSPYACDYARQNFGLPVYTACDLRDAQLEDDHFDACSLIEVIEHLPDPRTTIVEVFRVLKPGGVLYLTTPNFRSYRSLLLLEEWNAIIPSGHLYYFDNLSLTALLADVGFDTIEDLTHSVPFQSELEFARGAGLRIGETELNQLEIAAANEEWTTNGRSEGLIMCARKPVDVRGRSLSVESRQRPMSVDFEGWLVRRPGDNAEDTKVYFVENGRKRWITTAEWIVHKGLKWPDDVRIITKEELNRLPLGPPLP